MKDDVRIYASIIDDVTKDQIDRLSTSEAYKDCQVRVMPDCHAGKGCTIGTVISIKDRIVPDTVGVDIGCAMLVTRLGKQEVDLGQLDKVINNHIPSGFNIHEKPTMYTNILDDLMCRDVIDQDMALRSIGSLGGGNHFIELDIDDKNEKYLVIHSGSRNLGKRVCEYWQKRAVEYCQKKAYDERAIIERLKAEGCQREIPEVIKAAKANAPKVDRELAYLEGDDMRDYLNDMLICQTYARMNRSMMAETICGNLGLKIEGEFTTMHNYIDIKHRILRKGAVSALYGEELLIPMNMRDGSLLCVGKGNIDWLYSAPHGAGRLMSRKQAKESVRMDEFEASMKGIYTTSVCEATIDEAPMVYKPMEEIVKCIEPTVKVISVIKPVYNFKAKESSNF